jgi:GAF domain-containing protein
VDRRLELARTELDMELAVLSEVADGAEVVRALAGKAPGLGLRVGTSVPLEDTVCRRVLDGRRRGSIPDVMEDPELRRLRGVRRSGLRAYVGVPLHADDGRRYMLCCLALERRPDLGEADLRFLAGLGEGMLGELAEPPYAYLRGMHD